MFSGLTSKQTLGSAAAHEVEARAFRPRGEPARVRVPVGAKSRNAIVPRVRNFRSQPAMALRRICIEHPFFEPWLSEGQRGGVTFPGGSGRRGPQTALDSSTRPDNHDW